jgi:hypothetical protein
MTDWLTNNGRIRVSGVVVDHAADTATFTTADGETHTSASVADFLAEFYEDTPAERAARAADPARGVVE